jgi:hypothetical protein
MPVEPLIQQNQIVPNNSPLFTPAVVGTTAAQVIGSNAQRRGITFANPSSTVILYLAPVGNAIVAGQGVPLLPGAVFAIAASGNLQTNCGWQAVAASGGSNNLTILEFV